ncbi:MAG TPA: sulfite exporter TauE/SafE family protein [Casimicrobiaceae bacterium]
MPYTKSAERTVAISTSHFTPSWVDPIIAHASMIGLGVSMLVAFADIGSAIAHEHQAASMLIAIAAVILLAALVSSVAGFAFSALAGSALAYLGVDKVHAVQTMALCSIAIQLYAVWKIRESIRWNSLWPMLAAGALTVPLGVWLLVHVDGAVYAAGLGLFLTIYGCYTVMRRAIRVVRGSAWRDAIAGALGGLAGGLAGFPGSFVTIWCSMRGWDKLQQRAVYQPYILIMQIVTILCLQLQTPIDVHAMQGVRFVPFALLGAIGGFAVFERMTNKQFHVVVSVLLVVSGVGLLSRAV